MKTKNKALLMSLCAVLLVVVSVFGTLAYLTDDEAVVNTFTVGQIGISLDEAKVNEMGEQQFDGEEALRWVPTENDPEQEYHLIPGHTYVKDPTVTVDAKSEEAYVRMLVKVENIDQLKLAFPDAKYYHNGNTNDVFLLQKLCAGWNPDVWVMAGYDTETKEESGKSIQVGVYEFRYNGVVAKNANPTKLPALFTDVVVPGEIDNTHLAYLDNVDVLVEAHAIQAAGFNDADDAWIEFKK